jgi:hypothetical protein
VFVPISQWNGYLATKQRRLDDVECGKKIHLQKWNHQTDAGKTFIWATEKKKLRQWRNKLVRDSTGFGNITSAATLKEIRILQVKHDSWGGTLGPWGVVAVLSQDQCKLRTFASRAFASRFRWNELCKLLCVSAGVALPPHRTFLLTLRELILTHSSSDPELLRGLPLASWVAGP